MPIITGQSQAFLESEHFLIGRSLGPQAESTSWMRCRNVDLGTIESLDPTTEYGMRIVNSWWDEGCVALCLSLPFLIIRCEQVQAAWLVIPRCGSHRPAQ